MAGGREASLLRVGVDTARAVALGEDCASWLLEGLLDLLAADAGVYLTTFHFNCRPDGTGGDVDAERVKQLETVGV